MSETLVNALRTNNPLERLAALVRGTYSVSFTGPRHEETVDKLQTVQRADGRTV